MSIGPLALALVLVSSSSGQPAAGELLELASAEHLPLEFVVAVSDRLEVAFHHHSQLARAYYAPALGGSGVETDPADDLPPRLLLYEPHYRSADGDLMRPLEMTPDVLDYWIHALLLAYLHLQADDASGLWPLLPPRAQELYPDLEPDAALGLYLSALAEFGGHILSLANEMERLHRRGRNLCGHLEAGRFHFGSWEKAFELDQHIGLSGQAGAELYPKRSIARWDKALLVEHVFGGRWKGERRADFGERYCSPGGGPAAPTPSPP